MTERQFLKSVQGAAKPDEVWRAWTTINGTKTFFAPDGAIELKLWAYEVYFDLEQPYGLKGSEGCTILSFVPSKMLSFSWGAPPQLPKARKGIAQWVVVFLDASEDGTLVTLIELGWRDGEEGVAVYEYFDRAWSMVLARLAHSYSTEPIDWNDPYRPLLLLTM